MTDFLFLHIDAPLISFGGLMVDRLGVAQDYPSLSLLTGLMGNALGYEHGDAAKLTRLQQRLSYGVREDLRGQRLVDFQTIDLAQPFLQAGWTTRGAVEGRAGGEASQGTHIRERELIADAVYTVVLTLVPAEEEPTLKQVEAALREPERPLFIGRKHCLPSGPLAAGMLVAASVREALEGAPLPSRLKGKVSSPLSAWWPTDNDDELAETTVLQANDWRDWRNQIHVGRRLVRQGRVTLGGSRP